MYHILFDRERSRKYEGAGLAKVEARLSPAELAYVGWEEKECLTTALTSLGTSCQSLLRRPLALAQFSFITYHLQRV